MKPLVLGAILLGAVSISPILSVQAAEPTSEKKAQIEPAAEAVLQQVEDFFKKTQTVSVDIRLRVIQEIPGAQRREHETEAVFAVQRPNRVDLRISKSPYGAAALVSDGKTVWTSMTDLKQFAVEDSPSDLEALFRDHSFVGMLTGEMGPITDIFRARPRERLLDGVTLLKVAGNEDIDGVKCVRLHGEQEEMDWDLWVQTGPQPFLRKFVFSPLKGMLATAPDEVKKQLKSAKMEVTVNYSGWKTEATLPAATFVFEPPKGAIKVAEFTAADVPTPADAPGAGEAPAAAMAKPDSLKGKAAPQFGLDLLGGGKIELAQHKGKEVVVLDFWATWCGPCVRALPALNEVAIGFKDKGVAVYAVNLQEAQDAVKKFVESKKLTLPVLMDTKGEVAKSFLVSGIPQTVIIDKEGNVAAVHVGFSPQLQETLTKEIEGLLAK